MSTETKPAVGYEQIGPAFVAKGKANKYVIILGWLDAKFRYLEKYAQQYRERNYTVIVFPSSSADQSVFEHIKVGDALWRDYLGFYSQPRNSHFSRGVSGPRLFLYSDTDESTPAAEIESRIEEAKLEGVVVVLKKFSGSEHVKHAAMFPNEYWAAVEMLLSSY